MFLAIEPCRMKAITPLSSEAIKQLQELTKIGMPRHTMVTTPGRGVQAISMCRAISRGGREQKAADGSAHVALTPRVIDFQADDGLRSQC